MRALRVNQTAQRAKMPLKPPMSVAGRTASAGSTPPAAMPSLA